MRHPVSISLDKVDADLRALTSLENSKRNQSKSVPKWRFTYHRVTSPQFMSRNQSQSLKGNLPVKAKAFAAISLATPENPELQQTEQSNQVTGILPPPMINHKMEEILQSGVINSPKPDTPGVRSSYNKDKSQWKTSENLSHYNPPKDDEPERKQQQEEQQQQLPMTKTSKNQTHSISSFSVGSSNSINTRNWGWAAKQSSSSSRSRSRTQLEEEIAKMSSSRYNDGSSLSSFHWRPWIRHQDVNRNDGNTIVSSTTTTTTTPSPSHSAPLNDHHKNTWSEELQSYHDQLHATGFSHFHHHHKKNHHRHVSNPSVNAKTAVFSRPPEKQEPTESGKDTPGLYSLGDTLKNTGEGLVSDQGSSVIQLPSSSSPPRDQDLSMKKKQKRKHRQRHHTHPVPQQHLPSSIESSVDPVFSMHRSTQLEYRI
ncbi:unnamed protein product [Allacma fusca]|uniref:Uncharacterized protein n=1 Tax=Allacma fusca TaxID=39272 RepID=A0A8J2P7Z2_9HEXA|nr:unnamed protein product [Allacma fusca]